MLRTALAAAILCSLPGAAALALTDPAGDVRQDWGGASQSLRSTDGMDLVGLELVETPTEFEFTLTHAAPVKEHDGPPTGWSTMVFATRGRQAYAMELEFPLQVGGTSARPLPWVWIMRDHGGQWSPFAQLSVAILGETYSWSVPRSFFIDQFGAPPEIGGNFTDIHVTSQGEAAVIDGTMAWSFRDRLPDQGSGALTFVHGLKQVGAEFTSANPFRASNGEAGRFYYPVTLEAQRPGTFEVRATDVPAGWSIRLSDARVEVDDAVEIMVEVTVPFAHQHGSNAAFRLVAEDAEALAQIALGIHYVDVPQPAGHHDTVFVHAEGDIVDSLLYTTRNRVRGWPYMNTLPEDPGDSGHPIQPTRSGVLNIGEGQTEMILHYDIDIHPRLLMGLNVTGATKPFRLEFDAAYPVSEASLGGALRVGRLGASFFDGEFVDIATLTAEPFAMTLGANRIEGEITGHPQIVPFQHGAVMRMVLELRIPGPDVHVDTATPYLLPGGQFGLPLAEYHESIADASGFVQTGGQVDVDAAQTTGAEGTSKKSPGATAIAALAIVLAAGLRRVAARRSG